MTPCERIVELQAVLVDETARRQRAEARLADAIRVIASLQSLNTGLKLQLRQLQPVPYKIHGPLVVDEDVLLGEVPAL